MRQGPSAYQLSVTFGLSPLSRKIVFLGAFCESCVIAITLIWKFLSVDEDRSMRKRCRGPVCDFDHIAMKDLAVSETIDKAGGEAQVVLALQGEGGVDEAGALVAGGEAQGKGAADIVLDASA